MEVLLLLIVVVMAVLLIARSKRQPDKSTRSKRQETSELKPRLGASPYQNTSRPSRFDAGSVVPKPTASLDH